MHMLFRYVAKRIEKMRELTPEERKQYDKMVLGSKQINMQDILNSVPKIH